MSKKIKIAILDMNDSKPNQGLKGIKEICEEFKNKSEQEISISVFDVRYKCELPKIKNYDIYISSGGPGSPHPEGKAWEEQYYNLLDDIWNHNLKNEQKKYLFLICHSFQIAVIHWKLAEVNMRKSYSFGVMPIHKTDAGMKEFLFKNLPNPFYATDSRAFQCVQPDEKQFKKMKAKILALEKIRPHVDLERAIMCIRFSKEIFGTQFHPEASRAGLLQSLKSKKYRESLIQDFGMGKFLQTLDRVEDDDKIVLTRAQFLPRFLKQSVNKILKQQKSDSAKV